MQQRLADLMQTLKLTGMSLVLERELACAEREGLATAEVIERLPLEEFHFRQERSLIYRVKQGNMPWPWTLASFPFDQQPGVSKFRIMETANNRSPLVNPRNAVKRAIILSIILLPA